MSNPQQFLQKPCNYCDLLRDDGLSSADYIRLLPELLSPRRHGDDFQEPQTWM